MKLLIYADESGTHDRTGIQPGSEVAVIAGYAAKADSWTRFVRDWDAVLKKYSAPYFHFSEWAEASAVARNKHPPTSHHEETPYCGWKLDRLNSFFVELAAVAAAGSKIPVGGYVDTRGYAEHFKQKPKQPIGNPHEGCIWWFYESVIGTVQSNWPRLKGPISFFFDQTDDTKWRNAITNVHHSYKKMTSRVSAITFGDKKDPCNYGLQAADMVAYRMRQIAGKYCMYDANIPASIPEFDRILFGKLIGDQFKRLFPVPSRR